MVNFKRLLHTNTGRNIISLILGLGLATLFHKVCKDKDCILFSGPVISEVDGKIYKITKRHSMLGVVKFKTTAHFKEITLKV